MTTTRPRQRRLALLISSAPALMLGAPVAAQSLYVAPQTPAVDESGRADPAAALYDASMLVVRPPKPKTYGLHDQVQIIIDENSRESSEQKVSTKKDYKTAATLKDMLNIRDLIEKGTLRSDTGPDPKIDFSGSNNFKGDGKYERSDRFTAKITATVIDVKPNGVLVLEARRRIKKNEEDKTVVLSGSCRSEDVTRNNSVLSSQLADMVLISEDEGQVKDGASKGWISRVLDAVFSF
jgi:flagellar L-ring protein FlgH